MTKTMTKKMNASQHYAYLLTRRSEVNKAQRESEHAIKLIQDEQTRTQEAYDAEIRNFVAVRLWRLSRVGLSVLSKSYGRDSAKIEAAISYRDPDADAVDLGWLNGFSIKSIHESYISLKFTKSTKDSGMILPRKVLHMSDRDFAKLVRKLLRERKEATRVASNAAAKREVRKMERQIKSLQAELAKANEALGVQ